MSVLTKIESGYLFESDFTGISTEWEINDFSRVSLADGLNIAKGEETFFMFLSMLTNEKKFVLDVKNVYNPTQPNEMGGIVVYANEDNYICLEEYYDADKGTVMTYPWIRLVRDHNVYTGYWSDDGYNWNLVGVNDFGELSPKIGLFLEGSQFDMRVEYVRAFRSVNIDVLNPPKGEMQLIGEGGTLSSMVPPTFISKISFPISSYGIPFKGKFRWENGEEFIETDYMRDIWGGDIFKFQISMDLYYYDGTEYKRVDVNEEEFLGHLNSIGEGVSVDRNVIKMKLKNTHKYDFKDVRVTTDEHGGFTEYSKYVALSVDNLVFTQEISLGNIKEHEEREFYLEIKRGTDYTLSVQEVLFALRVFSNVGT